MRLAAAARATRDVAVLALVYVPFLYTVGVQADERFARTREIPPVFGATQVLLQSALTGRPLDTVRPPVHPDDARVR